MTSAQDETPAHVIPAQAGIQRNNAEWLDSRLRGNDGVGALTSKQKLRLHWTHDDCVIQLFIIKYAHRGVLSDLLRVEGGTLAFEDDGIAAHSHVQVANSSRQTRLDPLTNDDFQRFVLRTAGSHAITNLGP
jgi:hypothetical protein